MPEEKLYQGPIFVKKSPIHGYGVFAAEDIPEGALIEECYPLISHGKDMAFANYYFEANKYSAIPLGYGCIYNHSLTPNIDFDYSLKRNLILFTAKRFIPRGEELCSSYGNHWFAGRKLRIKRPSGWRELYQIATGIFLRFTVIAAALCGIIQGVKYLSASSFW